MLVPRKIVFFLFLLVGLSLYAQQDYFVSSYVRGNFYNRGRIAAESLRASDDLIFLNVRPHKDGSLSFENPRVFQEKGVTTWEELIKSVRADVKGTKAKLRLGAAGGEWKAMVADEAARTTFAKNIKKVLGENKLDGIDLDFEWAETEKEYKDYSLAILKMREVLGDKYLFSVSLHPVSYKISKEAIAAVDFISAMLWPFSGPFSYGEICFGYTDGTGLRHSQRETDGRRSLLWSDEKWLEENGSIFQLCTGWIDYHACTE